MRKSIVTMAAIATSALAQGAVPAPASYPTAPTEAVVDEYFGVKVADPYRPLENDTAAATLAWVEAERKVTDNYLSQIPFRDRLRKQIASYNDYVKQGAPWLT